ncbi:acyl carrier protein [Streptomyces sp. NPDC050287]|uniref:acyl carrier protein n=1 Tax=Streptomyces sp. NPDC050287 TaxID=3365608 RepID=UPI0037AE6868
MSSPVASDSVATLADALLTLLVDKYEAPAETTTVDTEFELLGFDSLILVEVAVDLSRRYGIEVADDELQEAGTAVRAAELLAAKGAVV